MEVGRGTGCNRMQRGTTIKKMRDPIAIIDDYFIKVYISFEDVNMKKLLHPPITCIAVNRGAIPLDAQPLSGGWRGSVPACLAGRASPPRAPSMPGRGR